MSFAFRQLGLSPFLQGGQPKHGILFALRVTKFLASLLASVSKPARNGDERTKPGEPRRILRPSTWARATHRDGVRAGLLIF